MPEHRPPAVRPFPVKGGLLAVLLLATTVLAACGGSASGIGQEGAVAAARLTAARMSTSPVTLVSAASGAFHEFEPGLAASVAAPDREVWSVVFRGTFRGSCGGAGSAHPCPPPNTTVRVVLDLVSGAVLVASTPA